MKKKKDKTMAEVTKGFENFIKGKEINDNNKVLFDQTIKKVSKIVKPRGSK